MFKAINYINVLIFSFFLLLVLNFDSFNKISTKLETIIPNSPKKELLKEFGKFESTKKIFLSHKGLDKNSLTKIKKLEKEILKIEGITLEKLSQNKTLQEYLTDYKIYKYGINHTSLNNLDINAQLQDTKNEMIKDSFSFRLNTQDPLNLFNAISNTYPSTKNRHLILKDYGYLSIFKIDKSINTIKEYETIYDHISKLTNDRVKVFSPIFYFVENSREIKNDVNKIILLSSIILILLYVLILKNIKLLFNTLLTLGSSILLSLLVTTYIFQELSIFVLVFGISISTVGIDYMFHHYIHKYYQKNKTFNTDVFFGMITTVGAFCIISFISFDLIKQICYFAIVSLIFSYLQFSFIYPKIKFLGKTKTVKSKNDAIGFESTLKSNFHIKPVVITVISVVIIVFISLNIKFDFNLKNLDVQNIKLKKTEDFFNNKLNDEKRVSVLLKANSIRELINNANELKSNYKDSYVPLDALISSKEFKKTKEELSKINFNKIKKSLNLEATKLGFKKDFFAATYDFKDNTPNYDIALLKSFGLEVIQYNDSYLSYALIPLHNQDNIYKLGYIQPLSIKQMFEQKLITAYDELFILGSLTILFIFIMLLFICKKNYFKAINYILFPLAMVLILSTFIVFNILHLFMLFIILAIGIDFGIYVSSKHVTENTRKAVFYSLLSTFAGFGVLIFSNITALFSIGIIATIGILAIVFLLLTSKRVFNDIKSI